MQRIFIMIASVLFVVSCGGSSSDALGIGAECTANENCNQDTTPPLTCLTQFKGGYCGLIGCTSSAGCPTDSVCITHTDNQNYCFRSCTDKTECNANRTTDNESNCSSNVDPVEGGTAKVCVPPSAS